MVKSKYISHLHLVYWFCHQGIPAEKVAELASITPGNLSKIINGEVKDLGKVGFDTIYGIAEAMKVPVSSFVHTSGGLTYVDLHDAMHFNEREPSGERVNHFKRWWGIVHKYKYRIPFGDYWSQHEEIEYEECLANGKTPFQWMRFRLGGWPPS